MKDTFNIWAYGGGLNSTAGVLGCIERGETVDLCIMSDTGGEKPETYAHLKKWKEFLAKHGIPFFLVTNTFQQRPQTLESFCLRRNKMPAVAYGFKTCSTKFKIDPVDKFIRTYAPLRDFLNQSGFKRVPHPTQKNKRTGLPVQTLEANVKAIRLVGFDAGEDRRVKAVWNARTVSRYPLIEWGWYREECAEICDKYGFNPPKSSCFFCPNNKKHEILELRGRHPDLYARALAMEDNADTRGSIKGLARDLSWRDIGDATPSVKVGSDMPCGCYDGGDE
jgi:hypothetical protein